MTIGTKSLLFGAHQFLIHPFFLAIAWSKLYGPPLDPRLWITFFIHDIGYLGKINLDGPEGKTHPELGAAIMHKIFGKKWGDLCRYHSRAIARQRRENPSLLCHADKLATILTPRPLYLLLVKSTGEVHEYLTDFHRALTRQHSNSTYECSPNDKLPEGIVYGSIEHWYWAMSRPYTTSWIHSKKNELLPQLKAFQLEAKKA